MPALLKQLAYALSRKRTSLRHMPSEHSATPLSCVSDIDTYIRDTGTRIQSVRATLNANLDEAVIAGNKPFFIKAATDSQTRCSRLVLMMHGLTESPFVTRDLADYFAQQGFDVLSILLPGHGTCPGDLLNVTWRDWVQAQADVLDTLDKRYQSIYVCGFSLGAALALYQAVSDKRIKGLFLFSPALRLVAIARITCLFAKLARWLPQLKWVDVQPDDDPFKYESLANNGICQAQHVISRVQDRLALGMPDIPVFVAASQDDITVRTAAVLPFFEKLPTAHKRLLWFCRRERPLPAKARCVLSRLDKKHIVSASHMSMVVAPDNPHYGEHGDYAFCNHYYRTDAEKYARCKAFDEDCLGEIHGVAQAEQVIRRLTYNPWHDLLKQELSLFIENIDN